MSINDIEGHLFFGIEKKNKKIKFLLESSSSNLRES